MTDFCETPISVLGFFDNEEGCMICCRPWIRFMGLWWF